MGRPMPIPNTTPSPEMSNVIGVPTVPVFKAVPGSVEPRERTNSKPMSEAKMPTALNASG